MDWFSVDMFSDCSVNAVSTLIYFANFWKAFQVSQDLAFSFWKGCWDMMTLIPDWLVCLTSLWSLPGYYRGGPDKTADEPHSHVGRWGSLVGKFCSLSASWHVRHRQQSTSWPSKADHHTAYLWGGGWRGAW